MCFALFSQSEQGLYYAHKIKLLKDSCILASESMQGHWQNLARDMVIICSWTQRYLTGNTSFR